MFDSKLPGATPDWSAAHDKVADIKNVVKSRDAVASVRPVLDQIKEEDVVVQAKADTVCAKLVNALRYSAPDELLKEKDAVVRPFNISFAAAAK